MDRTQDFVLEARAISMHFDGVFALSEVGLQVRPGEIHALLGENGAGKSTLVKILTGLIPPDSGQVLLDGRAADFKNIGEAHRAGIVAVYQGLSIVPNITVTENVLLGNETPSRGGVIDWVTLRRVAREQLKRLNQEHIPVNGMAGGLTPVQKTMVAIARAIAVKARVLIMDEPTAALTDLEISSLFEVLRTLRDEGVAIVYVSHRLEEVFALCDRATIMRNGEVITTSEVADITIDEVISTMVGRSVQRQFPDRGRPGERIVVELSNLYGRRVHDVSLTVREGEVLGIGGLAGSGRSELLRIIAGAQRRKSGKVLVDGREGSTRSVAAALNRGIALVPEERRSQGVILSHSIGENIALGNLASLSNWGLTTRVRTKSLALRLMAELQIKSLGPHQTVRQLSGGNQQKVVLAKYLARNPKVLLLDEPTRGIDVGTKAEIYLLLRRLAATGTAVIIVSSELPELIGLADRIVLMNEGKVSGEVSAEGADEEQLLVYCYGRAN